MSRTANHGAAVTRDASSLGATNRSSRPVGARHGGGGVLAEPVALGFQRDPASRGCSKGLHLTGWPGRAPRLRSRQGRQTWWVLRTPPASLRQVQEDSPLGRRTRADGGRTSRLHTLSRPHCLTHLPSVTRGAPVSFTFLPSWRCRRTTRVLAAHVVYDRLMEKPKLTKVKRHVRKSHSKNQQHRTWPQPRRRARLLCCSGCQEGPGRAPGTAGTRTTDGDSVGMQCGAPAGTSVCCCCWWQWWLFSAVTITAGNGDYKLHTPVRKPLFGFTLWCFIHYRTTHFS